MPEHAGRFHHSHDTQEQLKHGGGGGGGGGGIDSPAGNVEGLPGNVSDAHRQPQSQDDSGSLARRPELLNPGGLLDLLSVTRAHQQSDPFRVGHGKGIVPVVAVKESCNAFLEII